jgi:hypothetical protein
MSNNKKLTAAEKSAAHDAAVRNAPGPKDGHWPAGQRFAGGKYMGVWTRPDGSTFLKKMPPEGSVDHASACRPLIAKGYKLS